MNPSLTSIKPIVILFLMMLYGFSAFAQKPYKEFFPDDYPESEYRLHFENHFLDSIKIKVITVASKKMDDEANSFCRAWIKVVKNDSVINSIYFDEMNDDGYCASLYIPSVQPSPSCFVIIKYGDFNGHNIFISNKGKTTDVPGGEYFITKDTRFMFSICASVNNVISVYDFKTNRTIYYNDTLPTRLNEWYFQDGKYFSMNQEAEEEEEADAESMNYALMQFPISYFDFSMKQLRNDKLPFANLRQDTGIQLLPEQKKKLKCFCK